MDVVVLGSGTAVPVADRFPAGYLVREAGQLVLVDLGPGVLRRFAQAGHDLAELDAVLLTHFHTDHCADLSALLFALRNPSFAGRKPLRIRAASGLLELLAHIERAWPWCRAGDYELDVAEICAGRSFALGALQVTAVAIEHTAASLAYRITAEDGSTASFSGDAAYCDGVIEVARGVDLFVCDAAFPSAAPVPGHMTPTEAGRAAKAAGVRTLCLTHFYPECEGHDLLAEARAQFDGDVVLAADLYVFDLQTRTYRALGA